MTVPLIALAAGSVFGGLLGPVVPRLLAASISPMAGEAAHAPLPVAVVGSIAALAGLSIAWMGYQRRSFDPGRVLAAAGPLATLLAHRYFIDDLFLFAYRRLYLGGSAVIGWLDRYVLDGLVNALAWWTWQLGGRLRSLQSGRAQDALYALAAGVVLLAWLALSR
jgi:NADH-quinone oxidoreductase subunit L